MIGRAGRGNVKTGGDAARLFKALSRRAELLTGGKRKKVVKLHRGGKVLAGKPGIKEALAAKYPQRIRPTPTLEVGGGGKQ